MSEAARVGSSGEWHGRDVPSNEDSAHSHCESSQGILKSTGGLGANEWAVFLCVLFRVGRSREAQVK